MQKDRLRQSITILLLFALLAQIFTKPFIAFDYFSNTAAYAKYCENKARPAMKCNGKCQMMKKMKQEEKKDKQFPERKAFKDEVLSTKSFFAAIHFVELPVTTRYPELTTAKSTTIPGSIFHPPGTLA